MKKRCNACEHGRRDGKPCTAKTCLCRCHVEGADSLNRKLANIRNTSIQRRGFSPLDGWTVPMSFDEEVKAGIFDKPEYNKNVIPFRKKPVANVGGSVNAA